MTRTDQLQHILHRALGSGTFRPRTELDHLLDGLKILEPGLVPCADWWPDGPRTVALTAEQGILGAVGRTTLHDANSPALVRDTHQRP